MLVSPHQDQLARNVISTPSPPRWPFSIKSSGILDTPSKVQIYEYSKDDYLMISHGGVLSVCEDAFDFVTAERWEEEYNYHCKLIRIPFFARFKMWKPFYVWRKNIRSKKIHVARENLRNRLFIVSQVCDCVQKKVKIFSQSVLMILKMEYHTYCNTYTVMSVVVMVLLTCGYVI